MKRYGIKGLFILFVVGIIATAGMVSAFDKNRFGDREEMHQALETGDYESWKGLMQDRITEDNFERHSEKHEKHMERREQRQEEMQPVKDAIEAEDYEAWVEAIESLERAPKISEQIDEENFDILVQLHEARESEDHDLAKELMDELGIEPRKGRMHNFAVN